jgi:ABC-type bacteriocin/lantibiotic exporter with double-glycine peptidase domain
LDVNTEKFIIDGILKNKNDLTIIIIAHRISALKKCDTILLLKEGQLKWQGSFNEWLKKQSAI